MFAHELGEAFKSWQDSHPHYASRNEEININSNVIAVLKYPDGQIVPHFTANLVVDTGEAYYTELIELGKNSTTNISGTTDDFDTMALSNGVAGVPAADDDFSDLPTTDFNGTAIKLIDVLGGGFDYPRINDPDTANPGSGTFVFTWRTSYLTTDFDTDTKADVTSGVIVIPSATGTDPILNHWNFTSPFAKPATAALVVWVNHSLVGV